MNPEDIKFVQDNVPSATEHQIKEAYNANNKNILDTISYLLGIEKPKEKILNEWDKRREICDSYDYEMQKIMKK